jgi:heterodisulfide reductase subunit A
MAVTKSTVDALVVGGGIAGMQAALDLADQGFQVALVEQQPSIGGKMIALSKVFPTLDCCSCITTPKMAAVSHHASIRLFTYCEVQALERRNGGFTAEVLQKPRYVNQDLCTGCRQCEQACPVDVPHDYDSMLTAHRAIYVPFSTAVPQTALLDMEYCLLCGKCEKACPPGAVDFTQVPELFKVEADSVILATGYEITPPGAKEQYGGGRLLNVIDGLTMERLLAPTGPFGHVLRPSDGKQPDSIAYVQCAGSRDATLGVEYCSRVCCMYAIKQAMLISGALPMADVTIYYMDIRTFGKGYEQFYQNARAMGISFIKGKVARITEDEGRNQIVRVELIDEKSRVVENRHDLVVLSVGMLPGYDAKAIFGVPPAVEDGFMETPEFNTSPCHTRQTGIFATGAATGPMDIVDSIVMASAAAADASAYLQGRTGTRTTVTEGEPAAVERSA